LLFISPELLPLLRDHRVFWLHEEPVKSHLKSVSHLFSWFFTLCQQQKKGGDSSYAVDLTCSFGLQMAHDQNHIFGSITNFPSGPYLFVPIFIFSSHNFPLHNLSGITDRASISRMEPPSVLEAHCGRSARANEIKELNKIIKLNLD
jgi:hypothetical protein